jgi:hypothetical protein
VHRQYIQTTVQKKLIITAERKIGKYEDVTVHAMQAYRGSLDIGMLIPTLGTGWW